LKKLFARAAALVSLLLISTPSLLADEISIVKGLYRNRDIKDSYETSDFSLGARYLLTPPRGQDFALFFEGELGAISYDGPGAPSDKTSFALLGGVRKYLTALGETVLPYAAMEAGYINNHSVNEATGARVELSGLIYKGAVGLQLVSKDGFFIDLETTLFTSHLFTTEKSKLGSGATQVETEVTRKELYVNTQGDFNSTKVGLGYKF
jgi:hypothetical protein